MRPAAVARIDGFIVDLAYRNPSCAWLFYGDDVFRDSPGAKLGERDVASGNRPPHGVDHQAADPHHKVMLAHAILTVIAARERPSTSIHITNRAVVLA
jgi:hypothetical protein